VSISNQGRWSSNGALSARHKRAGVIRIPNPVGRSRFHVVYTSDFFLRERFLFTLVAQAATYPTEELNSFFFLTRGLSLIRDRMLEKAMLLNRQ
jgi:hypothetical protein